nr:MAG TPA: hypothetical protein [Caudoviricetes sp.]
MSFFSFSSSFSSFATVGFLKVASGLSSRI